MRAASLVTEDDAAQASTTLDQRRVLATHVASNRARGAVVRSSIETARMIVGKAAVGANAERDDLAHRAKQELEVRDVAGAVNETQSYLLESGRRERRDSLAKHVADLQKLHMLHVRADEETTTIRKAVTAAARSARCHDTRLRDRLLLSACTSDSIVATASTHLRHDTNAAQIKAKHALESRKRLTEAIQQKKSTVETIVHLHAKVSADVDITRAKLVSLRDELAIYQKLAIYQSKHHKICTAGVSKHRPTVGHACTRRPSHLVHPIVLSPASHPSTTMNYLTSTTTSRWVSIRTLKRTNMSPGQEHRRQSSHLHWPKLYGQLLLTLIN